MFSYKANAICMAGMTMPAWAGVAASHCWNRVRKPGQLINYVRFWPHRWTFAKKRTAHAQTHYRKSTQWQWASFVSGDYTVTTTVTVLSLFSSPRHRDYWTVATSDTLVIRCPLPWAYMEVCLLQSCTKLLRHFVIKTLFPAPQNQCCER